MAVRHPGSDGSMDLDFGPEPQRSSEQPASGSVTLSQEQFDRLMDRVGGAQERDYAEQMGTEVQLPAPQQRDHLNELLTNLPNAAQDPDGFKQGLATLLSEAGREIQDTAVQTAVGHTNQNNLYERAWEFLQSNYSDVAEHTEIVELATKREMESLRARGIDGNALLARNMEGFVDAVAQRAQVSINKIRGLSGDAADDRSNDLDRADMLQGGRMTGYRPARRGEEKPSNLVDELKSIQQKMGIY